jgi:hypothetical protein
MPVTIESPAGATAIRPFTIPKVPEAELQALRARIAATRWPDPETVTDESQGVPLAMIQELAGYWATDYDWLRCEATLSALPHFIIEIDGLDIHFIHVRSRHEDALPLIVTHGWPGSIIEQLKIIGPLTDPTAHGAAAADAFHLVIPSLPGYGYSGKPRETGWDPARIARAWVVLMTSPPQAAISRPGNSRRSSRQRSARALGRCANRSRHRPAAERLRISGLPRRTPPGAAGAMWLRPHRCRQPSAMNSSWILSGSQNTTVE